MTNIMPRGVDQNDCVFHLPTTTWWCILCLFLDYNFYLQQNLTWTLVDSCLYSRVKAKLPFNVICVFFWSWKRTLKHPKVVCSRPSWPKAPRDVLKAQNWVFAAAAFSYLGFITWLLPPNSHLDYCIVNIVHFTNGIQRRSWWIDPLAQGTPVVEGFQARYRGSHIGSWRSASTNSIKSAAQ